MTQREQQQAASLNRAMTGQSLANYGAIFEGFGAKGIDFNDIRPRENVFTYNAWRALGRTVRKGEHGVKVTTFVSGHKEQEDGTLKGWRKPKLTTVFHISQTEPLAQS